MISLCDTSSSSVDGRYFSILDRTIALQLIIELIKKQTNQGRLAIVFIYNSERQKK